MESISYLTYYPITLNDFFDMLIRHCTINNLYSNVTFITYIYVTTSNASNIYPVRNHNLTFMINAIDISIKPKHM